MSSRQAHELAHPLPRRARQVEQAEEVAGGSGVDDDAGQRLVGDQVVEARDGEQLVSARRRDLDQTAHGLRVVSKGHPTRGEGVDRVDDLLADGVAETAPLGFGVDGFDFEVPGRVELQVRQGVGGVYRDDHVVLVGVLRCQLQGDGGGAGGLAHAALPRQKRKRRNV
jgi:hypothetical protein